MSPLSDTVLVVPCLIIALLPLKVKFASPSNVFAVPEPVISLLSALLFIVVPVIPVKFEPSPTNDVALNAPVDELKLSLLLLV